MKAFALAILLLSQAAPSLNGVVTGQIRSINGGPAIGVRVVVMPVPNSASPETGFGALDSISQTDDSGRYRLERIPPGRYIVAAGLIDSLTYYPGVRTSGDASAITVGPGGTVTGIDFALVQSPGVRVSGQLTGLPTGAPAGVVRVGLLPIAGTPPLPGAMPEAPVQSDGSFEFLRIVPGAYNLRVSGAPPTVTRRVDVQDQDVEPFSLSLGPAVLGRVEIEGGGSLPPSKNAPPGIPNPAASLGVRALRPDGGSAPSPPLRTDGLFLWLLPAGEYRVAVTMLPFGYSVKSMSYGTANLLEAPLKIIDPLPTPSQDIRITLTTTAFEVRGRVVLEGESTLPDLSGAGVLLQSADGGVEIPITRDGRFTMNVTQAEYRVSVTRIPSDYIVRSLTHGTTDLLKAPFTAGASGEIRITLGAKP